MKINRSDADRWYSDFEELNTEEQYKYVIETLEGEITHKFKEELELNDILLELVEEMYHNKKFEDMIRLYNVIDSKNIMGEEIYYLELFMVKYHLESGNAENIDRYIKKSKENTVKAIDGLCEIVADLCRYGYSRTAVDVSRDVFERVRDAGELIHGTEIEFGRIIALDAMERIYGSKENNEEADRCFEEIEYYFEWDRMRTNINMEYLKSEIGDEIYSLDLNDAMEKICCGFQRYMLDKKGINFNVSTNIWFENIKHSLMNEMIGESFDGIFKLNKTSLFEDIAYRFNDFMAEKTQNYINVFGLFYMYDYLYEAGLISEELYRDTIEFAEQLKLKIIKVAGDNMWKVNAVYTWEPADSMSRDEFELEKEYSLKVLENNIELEEHMPKWYMDRIPVAEGEIQKILRQSEIEKNKKKVVTKEKTLGRNDKCPCGSGKKYKKCCGKI